MTRISAQSPFSSMCGLLLFAFTQISSSIARELSVKEIEQKGIEIRRSLSSAEVLEVVQTHESISEASLERRRLASAAAAAAAGSPVDESDARAATRSLIRQLNEDQIIQRTRLIDFKQSRAVYDDVDLRNLDSLLRENGLADGADRVNLSCTVTSIFEPNRTILLKAEAENLALVLSGPDYDADEEFLYFGLAPRNAFVSAGALERCGAFSA